MMNVETNPATLPPLDWASPFGGRGKGACVGGGQTAPRGTGDPDGDPGGRVVPFDPRGP